MLKVLVLFSTIQIILGYSVPRAHTAITYAKQGQTPWTVLLKIGDYRCSGSLIMDRFVITAANCFDEIKDGDDVRLDSVRILIGELDIIRNPDCDDEDDEDEDTSDECISNPVSDIPPTSIVIHEMYQDVNRVKNYAYDIAIITLMRPPRKSEIIKNIELPDDSECEENTFKPASMITSGFGEIRHKVYTDIKKITNVDILSDASKCKRDLGAKFNEYKHFCGLSPLGITTCNGDSGSPLSQNINGVDYLLGIESFGSSECSVSDIPTAFVKVDCLIPWIYKNTVGFIYG